MPKSKNIIHMDQADDVSALSMGGASAIAAMGFARRMRQDFAEMQLGIPEDEEHAAFAAAAASGMKTSSSGHRSRQMAATGQYQQHEEGVVNKKKSSSSESDNNNNNGDNGEELIEPFPKTYEEWQKKKEKKSKHKSKKHHKKSSSHSRGSSKRRNELEQYQNMHNSMENIGEKAPPIMEISIQSTDFNDTSNVNSTPSSPSRRRSDNMESISSAHSSYPSVASTASSSHSRSLTNRSAGGRYQPHNPNHQNNNGSQSQGAMGVAIKRGLQHQNSLRSMDQQLRSSDQEGYSAHDHRSSDYHSHNNNSGTMHSSDRDNRSVSSHRSYMTGHSTLMTGQSTSHAGSNSQSHVTLEDIHQLRSSLERSKLEEKQVLDIHSRLDKEVETARLKSDKYNKMSIDMGMEMKLASLDREHLSKQLNKLHEENNLLRRQLRAAEEMEDDRGLDDVLDSMEQKIRQLKNGKMRRKSERR